MKLAPTPLFQGVTDVHIFTSLRAHHFPQGVPFAHAVPARRCLGPPFTKPLRILWLKEAYFGDRKGEGTDSREMVRLPLGCGTSLDWDEGPGF